jgi:hypothetical protein
MPLKLWQYVRIGAAGECTDLVNDPLVQVLRNCLCVVLERSCDPGHDTVCQQGIDGLLKNLLMGGERHTIV